ncbi:recombinase family protein [Prescottella equi]|uniref:recombinase family protein n=1 Tax=Rhodococcus hoagii TaxID=43767 RepID=UPI001EEC88ED|nr:recombinase family protein [Prescottella equi]
MSELLGYARVSTAEQTLDLQSDALSVAGCSRIWTDVASGATTSRPELDSLFSHLRAGDTLVVWRLDRLGRNLPHLLQTITDLEEKGVGFRSLTESIDTTTAGGKLIFNIFGALASFERDLIRERTAAGLAAARARGKVGGRPRKMTDSRIRQARKMREGGMSQTEIAEVLGVGRTTLYQYLGPQKQRSRSESESGRAE